MSLRDSRLARAMREAGLPAYVAAAMVFLLGPIVLIVVFSFNSSALAMLPIRSLTLGWYRRVFADDVFTSSLEASLKVTGGAVGAAALVSSLAAFTTARYRHRHRWLGALVGLSVVPAMVPALVLGVALLSFYHLLGVTLSLWTVAVSHALIVIPFIVLVLLARLERFEFRIEEASRDLGANRWQTFRHVTFPLIRPSLVGALLLAAAFSLDEFVVTFFTIGSQNTLPTYIWSQLTNEVTPTINAIATLLLGASALATLLAVGRGKVQL